MMKKEYFEYDSMMKDKIEKRLKEVDVDNLYIDKKINERFESLNDNNKDFKKYLIETSNQRINQIKSELSEEYKSLLKKISQSLDSKITILTKDETEKKKNDEIAAEGRIQGYIIEAEKRIKKNLEERIDKIQQNVERMDIKLNAV